jgi:hypothetical protein
MEFDAASAEVDQTDSPFEASSVPSPDPGLKTIGFRRVENPTTEELNALYFRHRLDALALGRGLRRLMCAY